MSKATEEAKQFFYSGGPGTSGREVFEDSTALGPSAKYGGTQHISEAAEGTLGSGVGKGVPSGDESGAAGGAGLSSAGTGSQPGVGGESGLVTEEGVSSGTGVGGSAYDSGINTAGVDGGAGATGSGHHHHHHHHHHSGAGATTAETNTAFSPTSDANTAEGLSSSGAGAGTGATEASSADSYGTGAPTDRVGNLNQGGAFYERTTDAGPVTTGAAGTDRFDSDRVPTGGAGSTGATTATPDVQDTTTRAEGKSSGGLMGVLTTSDKDFTGRDRLGGASGAYADTDGQFQSNTSGPGGHTALTGREGNIDNNPVAKIKSEAQGSTTTGSTAGSTTAGSGAKTASVDGDSVKGAGGKKSFMQKVKEALA